MERYCLKMTRIHTMVEIRGKWERSTGSEMLQGDVQFSKEEKKCARNPQKY